jgi:hypothetical protein
MRLIIMILMAMMVDGDGIDNWWLLIWMSKIGYITVTSPDLANYCPNYSIYILGAG